MALNERKRQLPPEASTHYTGNFQSPYAEADPGSLEGLLGSYLNHENLIFNVIVEQLLNVGEHPGQVLIELRRKEHPNLEAAGVIAAAEATALLRKYPALLIVSGFSSLYRLLRTAELTHAIQRGGHILIIGSGTTLHEAAALLIQPPGDDMVLKAFSKNPQLLQIPRNIPSATSQPPMIKGYIIAIDPDEEKLATATRVNYLFGFTNKQLSLVNKTLGEVLGNQLPRRLNTILWHRAEPSICYGPAHHTTHEQPQNMTELKRNVEYILKPLVQRLSNGGYFIFTIGTGNNREELQMRLRFITDVQNILTQLRMTVIPEYSTLYSTGEQYKHHLLFFSDMEFGCIGSIIAIKR